MIVSEKEKKKKQRFLSWPIKMVYGLIDHHFLVLHFRFLAGVGIIMLLCTQDNVWYMTWSEIAGPDLCNGNSDWEFGFVHSELKLEE